MGEVVNLRRARKRKARETAAAEAADVARLSAFQSRAKNGAGASAKSPSAVGRASARRADAGRTDDASERARDARRSGLVKRSLTIGGHRTSVSLEDAFWRRIEHLAAKRAHRQAR